MDKWVQYLEQICKEVTAALHLAVMGKARTTSHSSKTMNKSQQAHPKSKLKSNSKDKFHSQGMWPWETTCDNTWPQVPQHIMCHHTWSWESIRWPTKGLVTYMTTGSCELQMRNASVDPHVANSGNNQWTRGKSTKSQDSKQLGEFPNAQQTPQWKGAPLASILVITPAARMATC